MFAVPGFAMVEAALIVSRADEGVRATYKAIPGCALTLINGVNIGGRRRL